MSQNIEAEYRRFIILKFVHNDTHGHLFVAPFAIRKFWEHHILDTRSYSEMAERLGTVLHYDPADSQDQADGVLQARKLADVVACYAAPFGEHPPDTTIWRVWTTRLETQHGGMDARWPEPLDRATAVLQVVCRGQVHGHKHDKEVMQLFIRTLTGETKSICLTRDDEVLVDQLKDAIWVLEGISPQDQRLIHGGKQLKDGRCLMRDYKISNESTIRLVLRLRGC